MEFDLSGLIHYLPDSTLGYLNTGAIIVAVSSAGAAAISKYTKNKTDDKIAGWLRKAHNLLASVGLHGTSLTAKRIDAAVKGEIPASKVNPPLSPRAVKDIRDHRSKALNDDLPKRK